MSSGLRIGFVGFGEAAYHIAKGLRQPGIASITAFDIHTHTPGLGQKIQQRAADTETRLVRIEPGARAILRHHDVGGDGESGR